MNQSVYVVQYSFDYRKDSYSNIIGIRRTLLSAWNLAMNDSQTYDETFRENYRETTPSDDVQHDWVDYPQGNINTYPVGKYGLIETDRYSQTVINGLIVQQVQKNDREKITGLSFHDRQVQENRKLIRQISDGSQTHSWTISLEPVLD